MPVVIDQIEGTVEPESGHSAGEGGQCGHQGPQPCARDSFEAESLRAERRQARLMTD